MVRTANLDEDGLAYDSLKISYEDANVINKTLLVEPVNLTSYAVTGKMLEKDESRNNYVQYVKNIPNFMRGK